MAKDTVNELQLEWAKANPRPEWDDPAYWASARPDHSTNPKGES